MRQAQLPAACLRSAKECRPAVGIDFDEAFFKPAFHRDRGRVQDDTSYCQDKEKRGRIN